MDSKPKPQKKYDETIFDPNLYGCWLVPKWTVESHAEAVALRRAKIEKTSRIKTVKVPVKKSEIKERVKQMKNGVGRAKAAFLSFALAILASSCSVEPQRPYVISVTCDAQGADARIECDSFWLIPKNCPSFGENCSFCPDRVKVWVDGRDIIIEAEEVKVHNTMLSAL